MTSRSQSGDEREGTPTKLIGKKTNHVRKDASSNWSRAPKAQVFDLHTKPNLFLSFFPP